jgi:release factor glutamine methyltransferase
MFLVRPPGVYRVDTDTFLLIDVLREGGYAASRRVLDSGTGALAFGPVAGQYFDLILVNPPSVPAATNIPPRHRISRCWDGGLDGRPP